MKVISGVLCPVRTLTVGFDDTEVLASGAAFLGTRCGGIMGSKGGREARVSRRGKRKENYQGYLLSVEFVYCVVRINLLS